MTTVVDTADSAVETAGVLDPTVLPPDEVRIEANSPSSSPLRILMFLSSEVMNPLDFTTEDVHEAQESY